VPTTAGRSRRRQGVHAGAQGAAGEHSPKIMGVLSASAVAIILVLTFTKIGRDIDAATQRFMLYYAGVFALIGLTGSVLLGLLATDRIVMTPGHRVMAQAVHRAFSFGTLAFLIIHITTEILAQRSHVIDGVIPFLSPFRTFYIGLGTIASDLIVLLVVTSIIRKRFTAHGKAWRWRAIHYTSYVAFVFGVLHGLLGGRAAKPYVDWSYGFAIAVTALGLGVRFLATSLRPKEALSAPPGMDRPTASGTSPMRAAALTMAQAQLGGTVQVLPAGMSARTSAGDSWAALPAATGWSSPTTTGPFPALPAPVSAVSGPMPVVPASSPTASGPFQAIGASPYERTGAYAAESSPGAHRDPGFTPLGAPPYGDDVPTGFRARPYVGAGPAPWSTPSAESAPGRPALGGPAGTAPAGSGRAGSGRPGAGGAARQPRYEPGYDGPPRFEGAPRRHVPQDELPSYPYGSADARSGPPGPGPAPRPGTGPMRRADSGPMPRLDAAARADTGPIPRFGTGPMPRVGTGPMPRAGTGPMPRLGTEPAPRPGTGPMRRADSGPMPRLDAAARADTGPIPRVGTGPVPRADTGPVPRTGTGPMPRPGNPPGRAVTGPMPRSETGPMPRAGTGPVPRADTGPVPRAGSGPAAGPRPSADPTQASRTGRGRRGTGRPSRGAGSTGSTDARRHGPAGGSGRNRGDE
jgi:DMSO/TMAO reductase YedYZ heme-binding membrane subunit